VPQADDFGRDAKALVDEARARVAAGAAPDPQAAERLRALVDAARIRDPGSAQAIDTAGKRALGQLERVLSVHRARTLLARAPAPPGPSRPGPSRPVPSRRAALRTRPTLSGNMDVRREGRAGAFALAWDAAPAVASWEVRVSERATARDDYTVRDELRLPAGATSVEIPLDTASLRVHVLGRRRDGRLERRAVISALTRDNWDDRWQRRASAS
jgi:hypothetical protein